MNSVARGAPVLVAYRTVALLRGKIFFSVLLELIFRHREKLQDLTPYADSLCLAPATGKLRRCSMSETPRQPTKNKILDALPPEDYERLAPHLHAVKMPQGQTLYRHEQRIEQLYFPTGSMISLVAQLSDGASVEVGITGFEGMVGMPVVLGVDVSPHECMVQLPDGAIQVRAEAIKSEFRRGGALQALLLRYTQSLLLMSSQVATCNRAHMVGERLARWLLMSQDRYQNDELPLTQEFLAMMLGTRRAGVTEAALILQTEDVIKYRRGHITITDRKGLEDSACECYAVVKADFDCLPGVGVSRLIN
jgi:CRP-like cAMP-binding protein